MGDLDFEEPLAGDALVTVATYDDAVSARLALNHLQEAGLAAVISDENTVAMDWLLANAVGGIKVQVDRKQILRAREVLEGHEHRTAPANGDDASGLDELAEEAMAAAREPECGEQVEGVENEGDPEEEPPPTTRERDSLRALRSALLGILFPPVEIYVLYLVYRVFVSEERLGARYRNMALAAAIIMLIVLGGIYAIIRSG